MDPNQNPPSSRLWKSVGGEAFWVDLIPDIGVRIGRNSVDSSAIDEEIRDLFLHHVIEYANKLDAAVESQDSAAVRSIAHAFQGTGGAVGAPDLSGFGEALSLAAKTADWKLCAALAARLRVWIQAQSDEGGA
jgi:HPt (histidine-containing phosphotransfer) domain-containing protein